MTKTKRVLSYLAEGNKTYAEIKSVLDLSEQELRQMIGYLQKRGYIETVPLSYTLTKYGHARNEYQPKSSPTKIAQSGARNRRVREEGAYKMGVNSVFQLGGL